eukprot:g3820.t1
MRDEQWMEDILARRREEGTLRELRTPEQDQCFVDFTSNDYLGLGREADLRQASEVEAARARKETAGRRRRQRPRPTWTATDTAIDDTGAGGFPIVGSGGSRLLSGNSWYAEELEQWIARFHKRPSALLFNSGYDANLGLMSCLPQPGDTVVCDELVHNSVRMGSRLGRQKETILFRHNDVGHLDATLRNLRFQARSPDAAPTNIFVAVESVYSMDGDLAPLMEILDVAGAYGALVIVDEAHGTGILGEQGRGLVSALSLEAHPALLAGMHSFGKAFGAHGAVVVGSSTLKEFLVNYARPLIYSTSLPLDSLACIKCAYLMQASADDRRKRVLELVDRFQRHLSSDDTADSTVPLDAKQVPRHRSPIQSVLVAGNERSLFVAESLRALGFDVRAIRKPTVAEGTERLRITLHAYNTDVEVESLARHIRRLAAKPEYLGAATVENGKEIRREGPARLDTVSAGSVVPSIESAARARL